MERLTRVTDCEGCWHSDADPCPQLVECMTGGPICHDDERCGADLRDRVERLRRTRLHRPAVFVGTGTCGMGAGAGKTLKVIGSWLDSSGIEADVVEVGCVGLCACEPIVDIQLPRMQRVSWGGVTEDRVPALLSAVLRDGGIPRDGLLGQYGAEDLDDWEGVPGLSEHPFFGPQTRWVLANCGRISPGSIDEYIASGGYRALCRCLRTMVPEEVCGEVEDSGLRGRGGGGFPTGRKWRFALEAPSDQKYLVCNADEGDPGAFMDRAVIEGDPHRLLEGMALAAYAIGAGRAYVYIRAEYPLAISRLRHALEEAREYGLLGHNVLDSGFDLDIQVKMGAGAFVCGEETALIHSVEGRRGMPRPRPPYPATEGLFGKPTVINNVETLANVPGILDRGADWFSSVGTEGSRGTKVFALSGKVERTGLIEVAMGTTIREIVMEMGGGVPGGRELKAVQIGGPSGGCIPAQHLDLEVDYESLSEFGAMMGSGGLVVMDEDTCMVDVAKFFMDFIQRESCGKCIPCREGTKRMLETLEAITRGRRGEPADTTALERFRGVTAMEKLGDVIRSTSLCGLGQTAPNPVLSTLRWFRDEYEAHVFERRCPAGVCRDLLEYSIDPDRCRGCTLCAGKCPTEAIMGAPKSPHYIIPDKCIGCGSCAEVCPFDAVEVG
jgi:NADH:ubiquinone oxidoreductase subunit F (NADH-binding)